MVKRIRDFIGLISDSVFALRSGTSLRFVLANLIMRDELRQAVAFARIDVDSALRFYDVAPNFAKKKLKQAFDNLSDLFSRIDSDAPDADHAEDEEMRNYIRRAV